MTPKRFYEIMSGVSSPATLSISGGLTVSVSVADGMAARLLLWLHENMPDGATQGDLDRVLDSAKWWSTLWASMQDYKTMDDAGVEEKP